MSNNNAEAAELALKSYVAEGTPAILGGLENRKLKQNLRTAVNLTEAPEDALCSLIIDLMHYCQREKIDWPNDVLLRARIRFSAERQSSRRL